MRRPHVPVRPQVSPKASFGRGHAPRRQVGGWKKTALRWGLGLTALFAVETAALFYFFPVQKFEYTDYSKPTLRDADARRLLFIKSNSASIEQTFAAVRKGMMDQNAFFTGVLDELRPHLQAYRINRMQNAYNLISAPEAEKLPPAKKLDLLLEGYYAATDISMGLHFATGRALRFNEGKAGIVHKEGVPARLVEIETMLDGPVTAALRPAGNMARDILALSLPRREPAPQ